MLFYLTIAILGFACSAITIKTLIGYSDMKLIYKLVISITVLIGWLGVILLRILKLQTLFSIEVYSTIFNVLSSLIGFVFFLFIIIMMRDIVWYIVFYSLKLTKIDAWYLDPRNLSVLNKANFIVVLMAFFVTIYASYEGNKVPKTIKETIVSSKISRNLRIVQISDLHISRGTSESKILKLVNEVNMQNPDVIVLTGDIIDDKIDIIREKINILSNLGAPYGVYAIMGNHEFYNDVYAFKDAIEQAGIKFLFNGGFHIANSNIYISGLPDYSTMFDRINLWRSIKNAKKSDFKILLSHQPAIVNSLNKELFDLVLSGYTHGGQIFPMHVLVKRNGQYLSGKYIVNGINLIISKGVGTWGPAMRLFAPSDIMIIDLVKK